VAIFRTYKDFFNSKSTLSQQAARGPTIVQGRRGQPAEGASRPASDPAESRPHRIHRVQGEEGGGGGRPTKRNSETERTGL